MPSALLVSPHLDDAAFSCGATAAMLAARGWTVVLATVFSGGPHPATGFALACQRDKGLADDVDYMALRRAEDGRAAAALGAETEWLDLPEAPHRGYGSAEALFSAFAPGDDPGPVRDAVAALVERRRPDLILAPAALGGHVDHRRVLDAVLEGGEEIPVAFWRDVPYVIRAPAAALDPRVAALEDIALALPDWLEAKCVAAACYESQLGFQFGGETPMHEALRALAAREGGGVPAERLRATPAAMRLLRD